jgi:hypothetical protein
MKKCYKYFANEEKINDICNSFEPNFIRDIATRIPNENTRSATSYTTKMQFLTDYPKVRVNNERLGDHIGVLHPFGQ